MQFGSPPVISRMPARPESNGAGGGYLWWTLGTAAVLAGLASLAILRRQRLSQEELVPPTDGRTTVGRTVLAPVGRLAPAESRTAPPPPAFRTAPVVAEPGSSAPFGSVTYRGFSVPKRGEEAESNQDAFEADGSALRFAVCDGVSQSAYPGIWAQALARKFVEHPASPENLRQWLAEPQELWDRSIDWEAVRGQLASWLDFDEVRREMAYATLLGLVFDPPDAAKETARRWKALAVGDSCLFQVRAGRLLRALPVQDPADFGRAVWALPSRPASHDLFAHWAEGDARPGDLFVLASDALARWMLEQSNSGGEPWLRLLAVEDNSQFGQLVSELRAANALENDDTTALVVQVMPAQ
jgi:hypothetical protein